MALFTPLGFDGILESPEVLKESIAISADGNYSVSSSPGRGTVLEHNVEGGGRPIQLFPFEADVVGFYGRDTSLIAVAHDDTLRIINLHRMEVTFTVKIRPGGLFVPRSGNSGYIGVVSPQGSAYVIEDTGESHATPLKVTDDYDVLWSSQAYPVGFTWSDDNAAYIYIRSQPDADNDEGATISSQHGINLFTVWRNDSKKRAEAYLSTYDEPHILKRLWSENSKSHMENVVSLPEGAVIDNLVLFSSGRPVIAAGYHQGRSIAEIIPPQKNLVPILHRLVTDETKSVTATCMGAKSFVSWTQTPVTPAVPAVTNYPIPGMPRYEIKGGRPQYTKLKTGKKVSFTIPRTNVPRSIPIKNTTDGMVYYRWVSPYPEKDATADTAVILLDKQGVVSAGEYSPTVKMLYDLGIPTAIVPVISTGDDMLPDTTLDAIDVAHHILDTYGAKNVCILAEGEMVQAAFDALVKRKSPIRNVIAYHADPAMMTKKVLKKRATTVVCDSYEESKKFPPEVHTVVLGNGRQRDLDVVDAVIKSV